GPSWGLPQGMSDSQREATRESDSAVRVFLAWQEDQEKARGPSFEELCSLHPELRERLRAIHAMHERARVIMEPEVAASEETRSAPDAPEHPIPGTRYTLRGEIAHGGMGVILEVYDASLRRTIAMKVVRSRPGHRPSPILAEQSRQQSRLLAEAQVLAQLD